MTSGRRRATVARGTGTRLPLAPCRRRTACTHPSATLLLGARGVVFLGLRASAHRRYTGGTFFSERSMPNDTPARPINYVAGYSSDREVEEFRVRLMYDFAKSEYRAMVWMPMTITDLRFVVDGETHNACVHYTTSRVVRFSVKTKVTTSIEWVADAVEVK